MKEKDVIVVGQGLAGTWLSWWLHQLGISFTVLDRLDPNSASMRAAGLINPVTGRRLVKTWLIEEFMPFAVQAYQDIGKCLDKTFIRRDYHGRFDFFPSVQMLQAFQKRLDEDPAFLKSGGDRDKYSEWFRYDLGWGAIRPCYLVMVEQLLKAWREHLKKQDLIIEEGFDQSKLQIRENDVEYAGDRYRYIIFCDGKAAAANPDFESLPFALNKGEGMLVEIKGLPSKLIFKKRNRAWFLTGKIYSWLGSS